MPQKPRRRTESSPAQRNVPPPEVARLRVVVTEGEIDDSGLSLEEMGQSLAEMLTKGADPYDAALEPEAMSDLPRAVARPETIDAQTGETSTGGSDLACDVSPRTILEAMLFVGHPHNEPLAAQRVASLMRGVSAEEIDELVRELNEEYAQDGAPYIIDSIGAGYLLTLRPEFASVQEKFSGKVREAKLSQAAIDILAVVAYQQPVTRAEIDKARGQISGAMLSQLVRRDLLRLERPDKKPRDPKYFTTDRFLALFGLGSLDDLPRSQELERNL